MTHDKSSRISSSTSRRHRTSPMSRSTDSDKEPVSSVAAGGLDVDARFAIGQYDATKLAIQSNGDRLSGDLSRKSSL